MTASDPSAPLGSRSRQPGTGRQGRGVPRAGSSHGLQGPAPTPAADTQPSPGFIYFCLTPAPPPLHIKIPRTGKLIMALKPSVGHRDKALPGFHSSRGTPAPTPGLGAQVPAPRSVPGPASPRPSGGSDPHHQPRGQPGDLRGPVLCTRTVDHKSALSFLCRVSRWSPTAAVTCRNEVLCTGVT